MPKIHTQIVLMVRARKGDTLAALMNGHPLVRTWIGFNTLKEAQKFKPKNGHVIAIVALDLDLEKF